MEYLKPQIAGQLSYANKPSPKLQTTTVKYHKQQQNVQAYIANYVIANRSRARDRGSRVNKQPASRRS